MRPESGLTVSGARGVVFIYVRPCFIDEIMALSSVLSIIRKALFENWFPVSHGIGFKVKRADSVLYQQQLQPSAPPSFVPVISASSAPSFPRPYLSVLPLVW